jgi:hypothetical protein
MRDDAVAPVIAVMLILAAAVTFLVIFNGMYIPSLKQASEAEHLQNVESAFQRFSSDIEEAVAARNDGLTLSEPVQLGGGDVFLNTLKSGGSISVMEESAPGYYLILDDGSEIVGAMTGSMVNISYNPVGNFWQEQGYRWQYGYLNVTKYGKRQVPVNYYNVTDIRNAFEDKGTLAAFAGSFGSVEYTLNQTLYPDMGSNTFSTREGNCSRILLRAVNLTASPDHAFASGNGFGKLELTRTATRIPLEGVSYITIASDGTLFGNATFRKWNESLAGYTRECGRTVTCDYYPDQFSRCTLHQDVSPVNITLETVTIEIGVQ